MCAMPPRGEVLLQITFGPSKSFVLPRAVSYASEHAKEVAEVHPGIWRASFSLFPTPLGHRAVRRRGDGRAVSSTREQESHVKRWFRGVSHVYDTEEEARRVWGLFGR
jgi:hypothetical protein